MDKPQTMLWDFKISFSKFLPVKEKNQRATDLSSLIHSYMLLLYSYILQLYSYKLQLNTISQTNKRID